MDQDRLEKEKAGPVISMEAEKAPATYNPALIGLNAESFEKGFYQTRTGKKLP